MTRKIISKNEHTDRRFSFGECLFRIPSTTFSSTIFRDWSSFDFRPVAPRNFRLGFSILTGGSVNDSLTLTKAWKEATENTPSFDKVCFTDRETQLRSVCGFGTGVSFTAAR